MLSKKKNSFSEVFFTGVFLFLIFSLKVESCRIEPFPPGPQYIIKPVQTLQHNVNVNIKQQIARVTVDATFYNPNCIELEGDYWFPVYPGAAVTYFSMLIDGEEMQAELLDKLASFNSGDVEYLNDTERSIEISIENLSRKINIITCFK